MLSKMTEKVTELLRKHRHEVQRISVLKERGADRQKIWTRPVGLGANLDRVGALAVFVARDQLPCRVELVLLGHKRRWLRLSPEES